MYRQPQIESATMLTALYCVTKIQAEIHKQKSMHKHNFALTFKQQSNVVTMNIRSR